MKIRFWVAAFGLTLGVPLQATPKSTLESDWAGRALGPSFPGPSRSSPISTEDLLRLRDIDGLSLSPNGKMLAFSIRQADPESNRYALRWFVAPTDGSTEPRALAFDGGQPIPAFAFGLPYAYIPSEHPKWSPDSQRLAMRRMVDHRIELWVANVATGKLVRISDGTAQVDQFFWERSDRILYHSNLNYEIYVKRLEAEAKHGWLLDGRVPLFASHMQPARPNCTEDEADPACADETFAFRLDTGNRKATALEVDRLEARVRDATSSSQKRPDGAIVQTEPVDPKYADAVEPIMRISTTAKEASACNDQACVGAKIRDFGWARNGQTIWFLKSEGNLGRADGAPADWSALYEWDLRSGSVHTRYRTEGTLNDCHVKDSFAYCLHETATSPQNIISINLNTNRVKVLYDPNYLFHKKAFPRIDSIILHDAKGGPYFAQVIYPIGFVEGRSYPLVVTQYASKGFLRGQVGNEYPIYPLSAAGFVILSMNWGRPPNSLGTSTLREVNTAYSKDGRGIVWDLIQSAIGQLINRGLVDPKRMALTGLSAGSEVTNYVLQRSDMFAAAITSSITQDITFFALVPEGATRTRLLDEFNAKSLIPDSSNTINDMSWSNKPENLHTPLLVNVGEYEAMVGFEGAQAIVHAGGPLEERIFPDEQHIKYHPQSIAGVYENNMQWLEFWLQGKEDPRPEFKAQYERWRAMRDKLQAAKN